MKRYILSLLLLSIFSLNAEVASAAKKKPSPLSKAKTCIEGKTWTTAEREFIFKALQEAERPDPDPAVGLFSPEKGALAVTVSSGGIKFSKGKLTGYASVDLGGVSGTSGGVYGQSDATLDSRYKISYSKEAGITIQITSVVLDKAETSTYIVRFSTNEKRNEVASTQTNVFLRDAGEIKAVCKGKNLTLTYADGSIKKFTK